MKTEYCLERLAVVCIMAVCAAIHAAEVSENDILTAARKWIADNAVFKLELPNAVPEKAVQMMDEDGKAMPLWRVDLQPTGYLVMSADDTLPPVVTFNTNGSLELPEGHPLPSMLKRQGEIFQEELDKPQTRGNELATENLARWNKLLKHTRADSITPSEVITAPMLTTKWNQNTPYNYLCPSGENYINRAITGCVPTAFAQILKYHEWPPVGQGISTHQDKTQPFIGSFMADYSFPYEWNLMRDNHKDTWSATYPRTTISRNDWAVSRLMMEMGVFATANYEETGTGAPDARFKNLIAENLKYAGTAEYGWTYYVDQQAIYQRILADMLAGRPALVAGSRYDENGEELAGHAFVADGLGTVDGLEYCHFNYGWSGSRDGWYLLTDGYNNYIVEEATTGIMPQPVPVIKMMSVEQSSSFTLAWDFPKRITAEAFRLTKTSGSTSTVIDSSIAGTARSYSLTGQSGTNTYTLEAKVDGVWQEASDGVTVTIKTNPTPMLSLMIDDELNSVTGQPFTTTVVANNPLQSLAVSCSRPDMVLDSSITIAGSGTSRTISFTPASEFVGNAILYLTGTDTVGNVVKQTVLLRVLENSFTWNSTFNDVQNRALLTGRLILMISGVNGDTNTSFFRNTVCEDAAIKANLLANYELWYDSSLTGRSAYASDLGSVQPFIAIIDPSGNGTRLRGHGGHMSVDEAAVFLDTTLPYFSLTDTTLTAGTTQSLELSALDPNAEIHYRLDSSAPTISDMIYSEAIQLSATTTISARAFKYGLPASETVTKTFIFLPQVATPLLNVSGQQFFTGIFTVTATCATTGATLRYTTDGTKPIGSSPVFPSVGLTISDDVRLMVCAFKDGMKESEVVVSQFFSIDSLLEGEGIELVGDETTWFLQTETYNSAPSAMQSQAIDDNGTTTMTAMVTGNGELSFYWKVSSEASFDKLAFAIDGVKKAEISGTKEWEQKTFTVTGEGEHKLVWTYSKDGSVFSGSDCGWVDDVSWEGETPPLPLLITGPNTIATASSATYTCTTTWSDGTTSIVTPTWSLSSTTYASVNTNGVVMNKNTTMTDQTVTLMASYTSNGVTKTASKLITLLGHTPNILSINGSATIAASSSATYTCTTTWSDGTTSIVTPTWSLSSTTYASVNTNGVVTNKNTTTTDQTVTLTASYTANGVTKTASKTITLEKKKPVSFNITQTGEIPLPGGSVTFSAMVTWSDGTTSAISVSWSLSSTMYASLSPTYGTSTTLTNKNTTTTNQTVTLNASYTANGVTMTTSMTFTLPKNTLTEIAISGNAVIETVGTATYICTATWDYGSNTTVTPTWTVNPTTYASVSADGVVTNKNTTTMDQTVTLTASYTINGVTKTAVKIITLKAAGVALDTQTLTLEAGWNWVSFNVLPESHKVGDVLGTSGFAVNDIIQTNGGMARFTGTFWMPGSFAIEYGKLYQIYTANATTVEILGNACDLTTVPLVAGWNWIANPTGQAAELSELTHDGGWTAGDRIQTAGGGVTYTGSKWIPANGISLEPGGGYQIYTANAGTLSFPVPVVEDETLYAVVDLSGGPEAESYPVRYSSIGPDLSDDACRTTELWLRKIPAGTFVMGSPEDELGRDESVEMAQHEVTLTQDYYIGVFECTQRQWELVMGTKPSYFNNADYYATRPVEKVSYEMIRGNSEKEGAGWPLYGHSVDASSFMGVLQAKTGLVFDLPTEAQWEYACRAGTTTALNLGKDLSDADEDANMEEVGRYRYNGGEGYSASSDPSHGSDKVGSYLPNAWGLYDMHGNLFEWCLDWWGTNTASTMAETDPAGPCTGENRARRGGDWYCIAGNCRSAFRGSDPPSLHYSYHGFRVACHPNREWYAVVDLSGGPDAESYPVRYTSTAPDLDDDMCRTTELWLRKIPAGTFVMGSPEDELEHSEDERQHMVTLTQDYYIGVFECTQKQWELVMGSNPSDYTGDNHPVEKVSYNMIRGTSSVSGANWPDNGHAVDSASFMGVLQAKTGLTFDLPTEAQWEYAARGGNESKGCIYSGSDDISKVAWYGENWSGGHHVVGMKNPNEMGLYDMSGNVWEWCLDWSGNYENANVSDPVGPATGSLRVRRGGSWGNDTSSCRLAERFNLLPLGDYENVGFRVACHPGEAWYAVVDLSGGPNATSYPVRYTTMAPDLSNDTCRTTELWLRQIPAGTFIMGSPNGEMGRWDGLDMKQHQVTLTQSFYVGVFEVTQKQWSLVKGDNPSQYLGDSRPVERLSYEDIRGTSPTGGAGWPVYGHAVDNNSFMGLLRQKTGLLFDLPTDAQWEYACRAGTSTALNSGKNLTNWAQCPNLAEVGRYYYNRSDGIGGYTNTHTKVGSYLPNAWGLYDMHGNVFEWCLDWWGADANSTQAVTDPVGPESGENRLLRGGDWGYEAQGCRSGYRANNRDPYIYYRSGFRVVFLPETASE